MLNFLLHWARQAVIADLRRPIRLAVLLAHITDLQRSIRLAVLLTHVARLDVLVGLAGEAVVADLQRAVVLAVLLAHITNLERPIRLAVLLLHIADLQRPILLPHVTGLDLQLRLSQQPVVADLQVQPGVVEAKATILDVNGGYGHRLGMHRRDAVQTRDRQHQSAREAAESNPAPLTTLTR